MTSPSNNCFIVDKPLIEPVVVIDVVASHQPGQQAQNHTSIQSEFKDNATLSTHLNSPSNKNYASRYMCVSNIPEWMNACLVYCSILTRRRSICQRNSFQPLQITREMLQTIIDSHEIADGDALWDLSSVFYTRNLKTEMVFCIPFTQTEDGDFIGMYYTRSHK